jgi:NAD(P)H-dependent nitrite reductase small subunit
MQYQVDTYKCEWKEVVDDPERRRWFKQFMNTDETESCIEFVHERGQRRPADWPRDGVDLHQLTFLNRKKPAEPESEAPDESEPTRSQWVKVGIVDDFPHDGGSTIKYGRSQIAVFRFESRGEWYATQNMCPHKNAFVLSRGIVGDQNGVPKVACPLHKKAYSLESGACLSGEDFSIRVFPVRVEDQDVYLELPSENVLDAELATELFCIGDCSSRANGEAHVNGHAEVASIA